MPNKVVGGKKYWYCNFRMNKGTEMKLRKIKKKVDKNWNKTFEEMIKKFNQQ